MPTIVKQQRTVYAPQGVKDGAFMVAGPDGEHFFTDEASARLYLLSLRPMGAYALESGNSRGKKTSAKQIAEAVGPTITATRAEDVPSNLEVEHTIANRQADALARTLSPTVAHILGLNLTSPTQWLRTGMDVVYGGQSLTDALGNLYAYGNNGIVSDLFAAEHPYWSFAVNTAGDLAGYNAIGKVLSGGVGFANGGIRIGNRVVRPMRSAAGTGNPVEIVPYDARFAEEAAARGAAQDAARVAQQRAASLSDDLANATSRAEQAEARIQQLEEQARRVAANSEPVTASTPAAEASTATLLSTRPVSITREIKRPIYKGGNYTEKGYKFTDANGQTYELFGKEAQQEYARVMNTAAETAATPQFKWTFKPFLNYSKSWKSGLNILRDATYTDLVLNGLDFYHDPSNFTYGPIAWKAVDYLGTLAGAAKGKKTTELREKEIVDQSGQAPVTIVVADTAQAGQGVQTAAKTYSPEETDSIWNAYNP